MLQQHEHWRLCRWQRVWPRWCRRWRTGLLNSKLSILGRLGRVVYLHCRMRRWHTYQRTRLHQRRTPHQLPHGHGLPPHGSFWPSLRGSGLCKFIILEHFSELIFRKTKCAILVSVPTTVTYRRSTASKNSSTTPNLFVILWTTAPSYVPMVKFGTMPHRTLTTVVSLLVTSISLMTGNTTLLTATSYAWTSKQHVETLSPLSRLQMGPLSIVLRWTMSELVSLVAQTTNFLTPWPESPVMLKLDNGTKPPLLSPARTLDAVILLTGTLVPTGVMLKRIVTIVTSTIAQLATWTVQAVSLTQLT